MGRECQTKRDLSLIWLPLLTGIFPHFFFADGASSSFSVRHMKRQACDKYTQLKCTHISSKTIQSGIQVPLEKRFSGHFGFLLVCIVKNCDICRLGWFTLISGRRFAPKPTDARKQSKPERHYRKTVFKWSWITAACRRASASSYGVLSPPMICKVFLIVNRNYLIKMKLVASLHFPFRTVTNLTLLFSHTQPQPRCCIGPCYFPYVFMIRCFFFLHIGPPFPAPEQRNVS